MDTVVRSSICAVAAPAILLASLACSRSAPRTLLITNVQLFDGTGAPARAASLRIAGDTIAAVGALTRQRSDSVVDGAGLTLAPGFIDTHSHAVLVDPVTVSDRATTAAPQAVSVGIARTWVNGVEVYRAGATTGARPGRVIRRPTAPPPLRPSARP